MKTKQYLIAVAIPFVFLIGCATLSKRHVLKGTHDELPVVAPLASLDIAPPAPHKPVQPLSRRRDTLPHRLTPEQLNAFLAPIYKANFDRLFAPRFDELNKVIQTQATSIKNLTITIDSIRNRSNKRNERQEKLINYYQAEYLKSIKDRTQALKQQTISNELQMRSSDKVIQYLVISVTVLFFGMIGLYVSNRILYQRIKQIQKSLNHA